MQDVIERYIEDNSDRGTGVIRFGVRCGSCREIWHSKPVRFTRAGIAAENENRRIVYDAMWKREWEMARRAAIDEAAGLFNLCPICHRLSCGKCFRICDNIDMCADCAERLGEHGQPVEAALPEDDTG